jgi:hypothetical protein
MLAQLLLAAFLIAHALIHAGFLSPRPTTASGPAWPFALDQSWLLKPMGVDASLARGLGTTLIAVLVAGYGAASLAILGVLGGAAFSAGVVVGSAASLILLALFFHPWLIVGAGLDVLLMVGVLVAGWRLEGLW